MIYEPFCELIAGYAQAELLPVSYPGLHFVPPSEGQWLEVRMVANDNEEYGMADYGPAMAQGFFRVLVCQRPGHSIIGLQSIARQLQQHVPKGTPLGQGWIQRTPSISGPATDDEVVMMTVTYRYLYSEGKDVGRRYDIVRDGRLGGDSVIE